MNKLDNYINKPITKHVFYQYGKWWIVAGTNNNDTIYKTVTEQKAEQYVQKHNLKRHVIKPETINELVGGA